MVKTGFFSHFQSMFICGVTSDFTLVTVKTELVGSATYFSLIDPLSSVLIYDIKLSTSRMRSLRISRSIHLHAISQDCVCITFGLLLFLLKSHCPFWKVFFKNRYPPICHPMSCYFLSWGKGLHLTLSKHIYFTVQWKHLYTLLFTQ